MNGAFRPLWVIGSWIAAMAFIVAASTAMGANLSTSAALLLLAVAPAVVIAILAHGQPSPSVAQILYSVETSDDRR